MGQSRPGAEKAVILTIPWGMAVSCEICKTRKERRFCPAVHGRICAQCCGTEREVTMDCPSACEYLRQARRHERPRDLRQLDQAALFTQVEVRPQFVYEREPLVVGLTYALAKRARADLSFNDRDAIAAVSALAQRYQTLVSSGLHYAAPIASMPQQEMVAELEKMIAEYREMEQKHLGYSTLHDSDTLQALVFIVRMGYSRTSGRPKSRAFLDFLLAQFPEKPSGIVTPEAGSRIVMP